MPASSQNRIITVVSAHPPNSKWWWNGAIRNTRRRDERNTATCATTDNVSATNSAPATTINNSVRVTTDNPANMPPSAKEPVSPMKILAGAAFHHRNPTHAAAPAAHTSATSSG